MRNVGFRIFNDVICNCGAFVFESPNRCLELVFLNTHFVSIILHYIEINPKPLFILLHVNGQCSCFCPHAYSFCMILLNVGLNPVNTKEMLVGFKVNFFGNGMYFTASQLYESLVSFGTCYSIFVYKYF